MKPSTRTIMMCNPLITDSRDDDPAARHRSVQELDYFSRQRMPMRIAHQLCDDAVPVARAVTQLQDRYGPTVQLHLAFCAHQHEYAVLLGAVVDAYTSCQPYGVSRPRNRALLRGIHGPTAAAIFRHELALEGR